MDEKIEEVSKKIDVFSYEFPNSIEMYKKIINDITTGLKIKFVYLSKGYEVRARNVVENEIATTKIEKQIKNLSTFVITPNHLFEFELGAGYIRYDVVLLSTISRIQVKIEEELLTMTLDHNVQDTRTFMRAYSEEEKTQLQKIREFLFKKLNGDRLNE